MKAIVASTNKNWYQILAANKKGGSVDVTIYGDIGDWGITAKQFASDFIEKAEGKRSVNVHLHSYGGDILEGLAIYNLLKNHPATISVYIGGVAASMGSVIAMAGDKVFIPENAWMMVHKPWGIQGGNADEMREYADLLDQFENSLITAYTHKTGLSKDAVAELLASETWLMGEEAVEKGFADEITDAIEISASLHSERFKDFLNMPQSAIQFLRPKGQTSPSTNLPTDSGQGNAPSTKEDFKAQEKARREAIKALFTPFGDTHTELFNQCLDDLEVDESTAKDRLLNALGKEGAPAQSGKGSGAHIHAGNGEIVRQGMANALAARAGLQELEKDNHYQGLTLSEMARASLTERGVSAYGVGRLDMVAMAFTHTSSDFGNVLTDVANVALLRGYDEAEETFQKWTKKGTLPDFKPGKRVGLESFPTLSKVIDGGEYTHASLNDTGEVIRLATYGKLFSITRQTIINDDLGAFTDIPAKMGRAAIRTVGNLVYDVLIKPPKMSDGKPLFHQEHHNIITASALTADTLDQGALQMAMQKDSAGEVLNIEPSYLIVPRRLKTRAKLLMESQIDPDGIHSQSINTAHKMAEPVFDARIDSVLKQDGPVPAFLVAGSGYDTIEVSYLDGNDKPQIEQRLGWTVDGAEFKVRLDAGVNPLSYRTLMCILLGSPDKAK